MVLRIRTMFPTLCIVLLGCVLGTLTQGMDIKKLVPELQLNDLELMDLCENLASAKKTAYMTSKYEDKIKEEEHFGYVIKTHYEVLKNFTEMDIPYELKRNWTYQVQPGNALLPEDKWNKLVAYKNRIEKEESIYRLYDVVRDGVVGLVSGGQYREKLKTVRDYEVLGGMWSEWRTSQDPPEINGFPNHLKLVKEAAVLNGFESVQKYWEALTEFEDAYERANELWEEISPFYKKLVKFVKSRLFKYYNVTEETDLPVYLLGIPMGTDWSNIADLILPHPQLHYDVESYLKFKNVSDIYHHTEDVIKKLGLAPLGKNFWENSWFHGIDCTPRFYVHCTSEYTGIKECNQTNWKVYLDAFETSLTVALNNIDYRGLTRHNLRFSGVDSAIETLGTLIAIDSLETHGLVNTDILKPEDDSVNMTKLLLTAIRVLPRMTYALMVDKWRLEEIETDGVDSEHVVKQWWKYRKEYTGMTGTKNVSHEYFEDVELMDNEPRISKFFGAIAAFQIFDYYKERSENTSIIDEIGNDKTFRDFIKERDTTDWPYLLTLHYSIDLGTSSPANIFRRPIAF